MKPSIKKILTISFAVLVSAILLLVVAATIVLQYKKEAIQNAINQAITNNINGSFTTSKVSLSAISHFPNISIQISNLLITDSVYQRPVFKANQLSAIINPYSIITGAITVKKITCNQASLHVFTDSLGYSNMQTFKKKNKPDKPNTNSLEASVRKIVLNQVKVTIENKVRNKKFAFFINNSTINIGNGSEIKDINFSENITLEGLGFNIKKGVFLGNSNLQSNWNLQYNTKEKTLLIHPTLVSINSQNYTIGGNFNFGTAKAFSISVNVQKVLYANMVKLVTEKIQKKLNKLQFEKPVNAIIKLEGSLVKKEDPKVNVQCTVTNNVVNNPILLLSNANFIASFNNHIVDSIEPGDNNSLITIKGFNANWGEAKLSSTQPITLHNFDTPILGFNLQAMANLAALDEQLNLSTLVLKKGFAKANLQYNGPLFNTVDDVENIHLQAQLINASAYLPKKRWTLTNSNGILSIDDKNIYLQKFTTTIGRTKLQMNAAISKISLKLGNNYFKAVKATISSPKIYLDDFKTTFQNNNYTRKIKPKATMKAIRQMDDVIGKGTIDVTLKADEVLYKQLLIKNAIANLRFTEDNVAAQQVKANVAGGTVEMNATIYTRKSINGTATISLKKVAIEKVLQGCENFGQTAITAQNVRGNLQLKSNLQFRLDANSKLMPKQLQGQLSFTLSNGALVNHKGLMKLGKYAKNRDLTNVGFAKIYNTLQLKNGEITIPRMQIATTALYLFVAGKLSSTNQSDISIQIPLSNITAPSKNIAKQQQLNTEKAGPSIYLRMQEGADGDMKVKLDMFKKFRKANDTTNANNN